MNIRIVRHRVGVIRQNRQQRRPRPESARIRSSVFRRSLVLLAMGLAVCPKRSTRGSPRAVRCFPRTDGLHGGVRCALARSVALQRTRGEWVRYGLAVAPGCGGQCSVRVGGARSKGGHFVG